jgi:SAM-dependent methyltransferase
MDDSPYYRDNLALIHHRGFAHHAEICAPGLIELLAPVHGGTVLEIGCGSGLLTRRLVSVGHRVIATDASPAMLALAEREAPDADLRRLTLPDDPPPTADAIVGVGHALNYLPDAEAVDRAFASLARALRPGGLLALDLCDLRWGEVRRDAPNLGFVEDDWAIISRFSVPAPDQFVREMTTFVRDEDGRWRRDDERHDNVLIDTSAVPDLLARHGVDAEVRSSFGDERLPDGLVAIVGTRLP